MNTRLSERTRWPHIGQRILKTTIAVFICLLIYWLRGYRGQNMPTEAAITAIICMQPYVQRTRDYAFSRLTGTLIGAAWGLLLLLLLLLFPVLGENVLSRYALMALGVMMSLYTSVLLRKPDCSSLAAIVFICIVIAFPEIDQPLRRAMIRITGVLLGTLVAIAVNIARLPRDKIRDRVFFVRTKDLVPDRFSHLPSAAVFRLNYLYNDGAKICLMSEHAPAFFTLQMSEAMLSVPLIVMDGAAIYDANENRYLHAETIPPAAAVWLRGELGSLELSYFIYTIHHNKTCIFHQGEVNVQEKILYDRLRRSPYRSYLEGEIYETEEIVYIKVIAATVEIDSILVELHDALPHWSIRSAVRAQAGLPGSGSLYFYSAGATMERAEEKMLCLLREKEPGLEPVEVFSNTGYRTEHDAVHLVHQLGRSYEPLTLSVWFEDWKKRIGLP